MGERRELLRKTSGKNVGSCNAQFLSVCRSPAVGQNLMPNNTSCWAYGCAAAQQKSGREDDEDIQISLRVRASMGKPSMRCLAKLRFAGSRRADGSMEVQLRDLKNAWICQANHLKSMVCGIGKSGSASYLHLFLHRTATYES